MRTWQDAGFSPAAQEFLFQQSVKAKVTTHYKLENGAVFITSETDGMWPTFKITVGETIDVWYGSGPSNDTYEFQNGLVLYTGIQYCPWNSGPNTYLGFFTDKECKYLIKELAWTNKQIGDDTEPDIPHDEDIILVDMPT